MRRRRNIHRNADQAGREASRDRAQEAADAAVRAAAFSAMWPIADGVVRPITTRSGRAPLTTIPGQRTAPAGS